MAANHETAPDRPPDAQSLWGVCPRCDHRSTFQSLGSDPVTFTNPLVALSRLSAAQHVEQASRYQCRGCGQVVLVVERAEALDEFDRWTNWQGIFWWPPPGSADLGEATPAALREAYAEGSRCLGSNSPRAAGVMFRRTIEGIVRDKGSEKAVAQLDNRDLAGALAIMAKESDLDASLASWAEEVRALGNKGAHFDPIEDVSAEQAEELRDLVRQIFHYLYEQPDRIRRLRESRRPAETDSPEE